jgi:hypothetical protein
MSRPAVIGSAFTPGRRLSRLMRGQAFSNHDSEFNFSTHLRRLPPMAEAKLREASYTMFKFVS